MQDLFIAVSRSAWRWLLSLLISMGSMLVCAENALTLNEAALRTLQNNPQLTVFTWRAKAAESLRVSAAQRPAYMLGLEGENLLGGGDFSGTDQAEYTLALSSTFELGGKRLARDQVAAAQYALIAAERQANALALLGELTQTFIATMTIQEKLHVAWEAVALSEKSLALVKLRVQNGAAPEAEMLRAKAALVRARLEQSALAQRLESGKLRLATLWGSDHADFNRLAGTLFDFSSAPDFEQLFQRVSESPALAVFASEARLREAELQLARSQSTADIAWQVGVRRFSASDDAAFTAGISVPLFSGSRNRGQIQAAAAMRDSLKYQRRSAQLSLRARLFDAWLSHREGVQTVEEIRREVIPALEEALQQTRQAYERGRYSYQDWMVAQRELLDARLALIDAASNALLNQALIEQLTGEALRR